MTEKEKRIMDKNCRSAESIGEKPVKKYHEYRYDAVSPCYDLLTNRLLALYEGRSPDEVVSHFKGDDWAFFKAIIPLVKDIEAAMERRGA